MRPLTRRDFLNESTLLAAAASTLAVTTADERAFAEEAKAAAKKGSANDKLRVAVVGVRGRGMSHVHGFANRHNCVVTTICDADKSVIKGAMKYVEDKQDAAPKFEQDIRKVVKDKDVDIIAIATPNHWHALAAIWAMQEGKHVYVEKPVSHNVSEGRRMVEAARKYKKVCQTGTQSRSAKGMRDAMAFLHAGKIGKVKLARGICYKNRPSIGKVKAPTPIPASVDADLYFGPAPKPAGLNRKRLHYDWHWVWDTGNGDLGNQGIHEMDKARWGLNQKSLPKTVTAIGGRFGYVDDGETANTQVILFEYDDCNLIFEVRGFPSTSPYPGKLSPKPKKGQTRFHPVGNIWYGADGFLVCPNYSSGVAYDKEGEVIKEFKGGEDHFGNFVNAIRGKATLTADILEGHLSSAMCHLGNISMRLGKQEDLTSKPGYFKNKSADDAVASTIEHLKDNKIEVDGLKCHFGPKLTLDTKAETFVGNKEADAMLTRVYRKGFEVPSKV